MSIDSRLARLELAEDAQFDAVFGAMLDFVLEQGLWIHEHAPHAYDAWNKHWLRGAGTLPESEAEILQNVAFPDDVLSRARAINEALQPYIDAGLPQERASRSFARWRQARHATANMRA